MILSYVDDSEVMHGYLVKELRFMQGFRVSGLRLSVR